jgi:hypothetical protein
MRCILSLPCHAEYLAFRSLTAVPACPSQSFTTDLQRFTKDHGKMKCYGLGLGLDSFKMVALTENFRKLEPLALLNAYSRCVSLAD